jgi:hypothetical protein
MLMMMDMHVSGFFEFQHANIGCEAGMPTVASCGSSCFCATLACVIAENEATAGGSGYVSMAVVRIIDLQQSGRQRLC